MCVLVQTHFIQMDEGAVEEFIDGVIGPLKDYEAAVQRKKELDSKQLWNTYFEIHELRSEIV